MQGFRVVSSLFPRLKLTDDIRAQRYQLFAKTNSTRVLTTGLAVATGERRSSFLPIRHGPRRCSMDQMFLALPPTETPIIGSYLSRMFILSTRVWSMMRASDSTL